jgi:outer membrane protein assembly factor BamB
LLAPLVPAADAGRLPCGQSAAADEWPTFGRDLANSRTQSEAAGIDTTTAPLLQPVWSFATGADFAGTGDLNGTPIVGGGCVFLNTAAGDVIAVDAATGAQAWRRHIAVPAAGLGGVFVGSPVFVPAATTTDRLHGKGQGRGGTVTTATPARLLVLVSQLDKPYVLSLSPADGSIQWTSSEPIVSGAGYYTNATPVVANGILLAGFSPAEGDPTQRGGISLYDVDTGALLKRVYSIPDTDFARGFAGAGIWTAPAVDADSGYAYAGTSNPYSKKFEHPNSNAILKIDIDPSRATFGTVVDSYKGLIEQYREELRQAVDPVCQAVGDDPNLQLVVGDSAPCLQMDLDFGAPPNLFRDAAGNQLIGDLQKAGVYHAVRTSTMDESWQSTVGAPCAACNAAAWAWDGSSLVGASSPVGTEWSVDPDSGSPRWASPITDGTHYQSTSIAGGVAFTVDNAGNLLGWDVATGAPLVKRLVQADAGAAGVAAALSSSGVAIASGLVIVAADNVVVAYRPLALP